MGIRLNRGYSIHFTRDFFGLRSLSIEEAVCSVSVLGECIMTFQPTGRSNFRSSEGEKWSLDADG
jgi:hypothetical protein